MFWPAKPPPPGLLIGGGGTSGGAPTNSQRTELVLALEDEAEALLTSFTLATPGVPPSYVAAGCPAVGASADADVDGIPDDQLLTFTNPPCTVAGFAGGTSFAITGTQQIEDTAQTDTTSYRLTDDTPRLGVRGCRGGDPDLHRHPGWHPEPAGRRHHAPCSTTT